MKKVVKRIVLMGVLLGALSFSTNVHASELTSEDYEKLAEVIKDEIKNGNLSSEEDIRKVLENAEEEYDLEISDSEKDKVVSVMNTVNSLGLDPNTVTDMVDKVYDKVVDGKTYDDTNEMINAIEEEIIETATEKIEEVVKEKVNLSIGDYFRTFIERIKHFIERIKSLWTK